MRYAQIKQVRTHGMAIACNPLLLKRLVESKLCPSSQTTVAGPSAPLHITTGERAGSPIFTIVEIKMKDYVEVKTEGHTFANNDYVYINGIPDIGPNEFNDKIFHVSDVNTLSFQLTNITTASIFGKFKGQVTLFDGTRTNETMSISWKPSIILCDVESIVNIFSIPCTV